MAADGVIHLAYMHDISLSDPNGYAVAGAADLRAIEAMGGALEGSGKPLVIASGTLGLAWMLPPGQLATETDAFDPASTQPRIASENAVIALAERGVRGLDRSAAADRAQLARSPRLHAAPDRDRPRQGRVRLRRRRR